MRIVAISACILKTLKLVGMGYGMFEYTYRGNVSVRNTGKPLVMVLYVHCVRRVDIIVRNCFGVVC